MVGFIIGLFVGGGFGVALAAFFVAVNEDDKENKK